MLKNHNCSTPFTVFGIKRFFKRNNFRHKIRFSQAQHAISDFVFWKTSVFSMRLFKNLSLLEAPPQFLQETKRFARVKDSSRFSALCDLPETIKNFEFFPSISSRGRMVFEIYAYPFGYFWRFKIDEILMSLGSPYDIAHLVFVKSSQVFAKHGFASVFKFLWSEIFI